MATRRAKVAGQGRVQRSPSRTPRKPRKPRKQAGPLIIDRVAPALLFEAKRKTREALDAREHDLTFMTLLGRESNWLHLQLPPDFLVGANGKNGASGTNGKNGKNGATKATRKKAREA